MNHTLIIRQALISEKVYVQMETGVYTFLVSEQSTKKDIKKAIENQFKVRVVKVNISTKPSKKKRIAKSRKMTETSSAKKAIVYLEKGQKISALSPKTEAKKEKKDSKPAENDKEKKGLMSRIKKSKDEKEIK